MDEESKSMTAFMVGPLGFYECERMPFGLTNTPTTFQQLMETCLGDLNLKWCLIYLDDIVIFLKDPTSHPMRLEAVFKKLEYTGLKLKLSRCELFHQQITYLGNIFSTQGIATHIKKTEVIKKWHTPTTITEIQNFLRFTGYYHQLILKFTQIAQPLYELTSRENAGKKRASITWDDRCQWSFNELKCLCTMKPVLAYTDFTRPFKLHTNVCGSGLGAILY